MSDSGNIIGSRILSLIGERGITQHALAVRAGITDTSMSRYISGDRIPDALVILKIAKGLHTTSDYLLGYNAEKEDDEFVYRSTLQVIRENTEKWTGKQKAGLVNALFGIDDRNGR